jgi:hypothetical protein
MPHWWNLGFDGLRSSSMATAGVRRAVEAVEGVTRSWFEWKVTKETISNVLVVEVDWDTDPDSEQHLPFMLDAIGDAAKEFLGEGSTKQVNSLIVVPKPPKASSPHDGAG